MSYQPLDLIVHKKSAKSGRIVETQPYRLHIKDRVRYFEKPAGSSLFFYENGEPVPAEKTVDFKLAPVVTKYTLEQEIAKLRNEHARMSAELAAHEEAKLEKATAPEVVAPVAIKVEAPKAKDKTSA